MAPGAEAESLATEIQNRLTTWTDPKSGLPVIHRVYRQDRMFTGPHAVEAPDLYIGTARGYRTSWQTAMGAAPQAQMENNAKKSSGDHLVDAELVPGILFSTRAFAGPKPSLADLTPAIIRLSGVH